MYAHCFCTMCIKKTGFVQAFSWFPHVLFTAHICARDDTRFTAYKIYAIYKLYLRHMRRTEYINVCWNCAHCAQCTCSAFLVNYTLHNICFHVHFRRRRHVTAHPQYVHVYMWICVYVYMYIYVYMCICVYVYMCRCVYVYIYIGAAGVLLCVCVCAHTCVPSPWLSFSRCVEVRAYMQIHATHTVFC